MSTTVINPPAPVELNGTRKAAILTLMLGEDAASNIFKHLGEEEIERIAREVATLGRVPSELGIQVLEEFHQMWQAADYLTRGGVEYAQKLLVKSLGPELARRMLDRVVKSFESTMAFNALEKADPQQLSKFILTEHPQTIALILAHLKPAQASQLLYSLPEDLRVDVLTRMASLDEISPEVITRISSVIEQRLKALGGATHESYGGVRAVAELLNRLDRTVSQPVLEAIENQSPDLAVSIRNLMFVFDDLLGVEDSALREIIQRADKKVLTIALKGANEEIRSRFFKNMSKRAAEMLKEEMEVLGAIRLREVEKAQHEIVAIARKLEEEGLLVDRRRRRRSVCRLGRSGSPRVPSSGGTDWEGAAPREDAPMLYVVGGETEPERDAAAGAARRARGGRAIRRAGGTPGRARARGLHQGLRRGRARRRRGGRARAPTRCCAASRRPSTTWRSCAARSRETPSSRWCSWRWPSPSASCSANCRSTPISWRRWRTSRSSDSATRRRPRSGCTPRTTRRWSATEASSGRARRSSVVPDPSVQRGGCVVESDFGFDRRDRRRAVRGAVAALARGCHREGGASVR